MNKEQAQNNEIEETIAGIREMAENAFRGKYSDVDEEKLVRAINLINRQNQQIESLQRERDNPQPLTVDDGCEYHCDNVDDSPWECDKCGAAWNLESGTPFDNNMHYCSDCGRPILSIRYNEWYYEFEDDCGDREVVMSREEYERSRAIGPKGENHD